MSSGHLSPSWSFFLFACLVSSIVSESSSASLTSTYPLVPSHVQRARRSRSLEENHPSIRRRDVAQQVGALYQGYGTHYIDLWCGTPPQRQTVIVDTGSGVTAFPCSDCKNECGVPKYHVDNLFDEHESSTFHENGCEHGCKTSRGHCNGGQCKITMSYAEGSRWDAFESIDSCYVGGPHEVPLTVDSGTEDIDPNHASHFAFELVFGCQTYLTGLFKTQLADGIMGMDSRSEAFWSQMYQAGKMGDKKQFALCFSRPPTAERKGTEAGALTLGGVDQRLHDSPMVYTDAASQGRSGFFSVKVRRVLLRDGSAGESVKSNKINPNEGVVELNVPESSLNQGGIIVDSGTTDTYWNRAISTAFQTAFQQMAGRAHSNTAVSLTEAELLALPTILFQLYADPGANPDMDPQKGLGLAGYLDPAHPADVMLAFPPSHYMEYDADTGKYTSRFYATESGGSVLGANAMMGHDILFDSDNDRIGWAESSCDYTNLVTSGGYEFPITGELQEPAAPTGTTDNAGGSPDDIPGTPSGIDSEINGETPGALNGIDGGIVTPGVPVAPRSPGTVQSGTDGQASGISGDGGIASPAMGTLPSDPPVIDATLAETTPPEATLTPGAASGIDSEPTGDSDGISAGIETNSESEATLTPGAPSGIDSEPTGDSDGTPGGIDTNSEINTPGTPAEPTESIDESPNGTPSQPPGESTGGATDASDNADDEEKGGKTWQKVKDTSAVIGHDIKEGFNKFLEVCDSPECRYPVGIGLLIALCTGICVSYCCRCCWCRRKHKYQRASTQEVELVNGDFSSYKDDPETRSNGGSASFSDEPSSSSMRFQEKPSRPPRSRKPEFQGDFI
jgi:hypothetical protein